MSIVAHILFGLGLLVLALSSFGSWINTRKIGPAYELGLSNEPLAESEEEIAASTFRVVEDFYNEVFGNTRFGLIAMICFTLSWAILTFWRPT